MVVRIEAISRIESHDISARFRDKAAELRARVSERIADDIVDFSPVDTGTYIMAHVADTGSGTEDAPRSSKGKARRRNRQQFQNLARGNLKRSVTKDAILNSAEVHFRNRAEHAARVEYLGWGGGAEAEAAGSAGEHTPGGPYRVYAMASARARQHVEDVAREMGFDSK